jgi:hypothetical protein
MENESAGLTAWRRAAEKEGLDEELYCFVVIDTMLSGIKPGPEAAKLILQNFKALGRELQKIGIEERKKEMRTLVLAALEAELAHRLVPVKATANGLSRKIYGIDNVRWLKLDQLAGVFYSLVKESAT